jgi:hypothetical protein
MMQGTEIGCRDRRSYAERRDNWAKFERRPAPTLDLRSRKTGTALSSVILRTLLYHPPIAQASVVQRRVKTTTRHLSPCGVAFNAMLIHSHINRNMASLIRPSDDDFLRHSSSFHYLIR